MKQAKLVLTATAILAVVGGALAYNARIGAFQIYTKSAPNASCNSLVTSSLFKTTTATAAPIVSYATTPVNTTTAACPNRVRLTTAVE